MRIFRFLFFSAAVFFLTSRPGWCEEPAKTLPAAAPAAAAPAPKPQGPSPISVKAEVNRAVMTIGDPVEFTVTLKHTPEVQILSSIPAPEEGILKIKKVDEIHGKEGKMIVEGRKYTLTTFRLGDFVLDPLQIQYRIGGGEAQTLETDKIYITVKSVAEGESKTDIKGLKAILHLPKQVLAALLAGLLIAAAVLGFLLFQKFRRKAGENREAGPVLTPAEEALFSLNQLFDSDLLRRGKIKDYYLRLSEILRVYFEKRFEILAVEYTTDEIMNALKAKGIERSLREKIQEVLEAADLAKFAKWKPEPPEIIQINQKSKQIVEISRPSSAETSAPETAHGV